MSIELQTEKLIKSISALAKITTELVDLTRMLHRERAVQLQQEFEEARGMDDVRRVNFSMWFLAERLKALTDSAAPEFNRDEMPSLVRDNGADHGH